MTASLGSLPESSRCRHGFLVGDRSELEDFELGSDGTLSPTAEKGLVTGIRVHLKRGECLIACDSNGKSDPYCKLKIGKFSKHQSETVNKNLNPQWLEEFFMECPQPCSVPLSLEVWDSDWMASDDYMGGAEIDLSKLILNESKEFVVELKDLQKKKTLPDSAGLGAVYLSLTLVKECPKKKQTRASTLKLKGGRLVTVDLIEARRLCPMDDNGLADPYVKLNLGAIKHRSKTKEKTLEPVWKQRFEFPLHDSSTKLVLSMFDYDKGGKDDFMGKTEVNIVDLEIGQTYDKWCALSDDGGEVHILVTVASLFNDGNAQALSLKCQNKNLGHLTVKIHNAKGLKSADFNGKSDPFVVVELGNLRQRTATIPKTLNPVWERSMEFVVKDIFQVLEVTVYDEDQGNKAEFLGKIIIPLLEMKSHGPEPKAETFVLKNKSLLGRAQGEIQLTMELDYKKIAYKELIMRHEQKHMESEEKFKLHRMSMNVNRVKEVIMAIVRFFEVVDGLQKWRYGFMPSFCSMMVWIFWCLYLELWMLPLHLLLVPAILYFYRKNARSTTSDRDGNVTVYDEEEEDEEEDGCDDEPKSGFADKYRKMKVVGQTIQSALGEVASMGERLKNLANWTVPVITQIVCVVLVLASVALYFIPLNYILLVVMTRKFIKKGLAHYHPFGFGKLPANHQPVNEVLELLGRVPSDYELTQRKRLPPKNMQGRRTRSSKRA